jgi:hypothetical protein
MSVSHCTPDYYAALLSLFREYSNELQLAKITDRVMFGGNKKQGYAQTRIAEVLI